MKLSRFIGIATVAFAGNEALSRPSYSHSNAAVTFAKHIDVAFISNGDRAFTGNETVACANHINTTRIGDATVIFTKRAAVVLISGGHIAFTGNI